MRRTLANIAHLGVKELWGLWRDPAMLVLIVFMFGFSVYSGARSMPQMLNRAPIAIVDEDASPLSTRIASAFFPPQFVGPTMIGLDQVDRGMDAGVYTFVLVIPVNFQRDVLAGRVPALQLNVDATRMTQAFLRQQQAIMTRADARPLLPAIKCPTLVLVGDGDELTPLALSQEIAAGVAGSRLVVIADCGHLSTMERPDAVNRALVEWMAG